MSQNSVGESSGASSCEASESDRKVSIVPPPIPASAVPASILDEISARQVSTPPPLPKDALDSAELEAASFAKVESDRANKGAGPEQLDGGKKIAVSSSEDKKEGEDLSQQQRNQRQGEMQKSEETKEMASNEVAALNLKLQAAENRCKKLEEDLKKEKKEKEDLTKEIERLKARLSQQTLRDQQSPPTPRTAEPFQKPENADSLLGSKGSTMLVAEEPPAPQFDGATREHIATVLRQAVMEQDVEKLMAAIDSANKAGFEFEANAGKKALSRIKK